MPKQVKVSWRTFMKKRMGPYMKEYGGHGPAIKQIAKEWKDKQSKKTKQSKKKRKAKRQK